MVSAIYSFEMKFIKCNILRYLILVNRGTCTICRDVAQLLVSLVAMSNLIIKLYYDCFICSSFEAFIFTEIAN